MALSTTVYAIIEYVNETQHDYSGPFNTFARTWYWAHVATCVVGVALAWATSSLLDAFIISLVFGLFSLVSKITKISFAALIGSGLFSALFK